MVRKFIGQVVSDKMDKTAVVSVTRTRKHRLYHKQYKVSKKFFVHDPDNALGIGDTVQITETRPLSKYKCWTISKVISKSIERQTG